MIRYSRGSDHTVVIRTILLTVAAAFVLSACSDAEPEPTVTPAPPTATAELEEAPLTLDDQLTAIERAIEELRGIDTPPAVPHKFVDQDGMAARLAEELNDPEVLGQIEHEETLFKLLGIIPQDADLNEIYEGMLGSQVLGLYDPEKEEFFVLAEQTGEDQTLDTEAQLTYAHEYVHRLQDAKFDLEELEELAQSDDMSLAIAALIEGDATTAQGQYMIANFDLWELTALLESTLAAQAELPEAPYFLQKSLEFPYAEGAAFIAIIHQMGQFAAVDAVFADPPESTEQILHAEKYIENELPIELDIADDLLGGDWSVDAENVLGEFFVRTWLESLGSENAESAAAGWGGDAYAIFNDLSGETALGMTLAWDSSGDADQFMSSLSNALNDHDEYTRQGSGLDGVLESWSGPGGATVVSRWSSDAGRDMIGISVAQDSAIAHELIVGLATG